MSKTVKSHEQSPKSHPCPNPRHQSEWSYFKSTITVGSEHNLIAPSRQIKHPNHSSPWIRTSRKPLSLLLLNPLTSPSSRTPTVPPHFRSLTNNGFRRVCDTATSSASTTTATSNGSTSTASSYSPAISGGSYELFVLFCWLQFLLNVFLIL